MDFNDPHKDKSASSTQKMIFSAILVLVLLQLYIIAKSLHAPERTSHSLEGRIAPAVPAQPRNITQPNNSRAINTEELRVSFPVSGRVGQMLVAEHAAVKQDQVLAVLDTVPFEKAVDGARAQLKVAQEQDRNLGNVPNPNFAAIDAAKAQIEAAQHTYDVAKDELAKRRKLVIPGQTDNVYDDDVQNEHDAKLDLERAQRKLAHEEKVGREAMGESGYMAAIRIARNHITDAEADLADTQLLAPSDGVVVSRNVEVGDNVAAGAAVYTLSVPVKPAP